MGIPSGEIVLEWPIQQPVVSFIILFLSMQSTETHGGVQLKMVPAFVSPLAQETAGSFQDKVVNNFCAFLAVVKLQHARQVHTGVTASHNNGVDRNPTRRQTLYHIRVG
jgi:hypothetical protein